MEKGHLPCSDFMVHGVNQPDFSALKSTLIMMQEKTVRAIWFGWRCGWRTWRDVHPKEPHQIPSEAAVSQTEKRATKRVCREQGSERGSTAIVALIFQAPGDLGCSQVKQSSWAANLFPKWASPSTGTTSRKWWSLMEASESSQPCGEPTTMSRLQSTTSLTL